MIILFIDDDPEDTEVFCDAVALLNPTQLSSTEEEKIECVTANNGCTAVDILPTLETPPALIFLDINMPLMGGKECLQFLKNSEKYSKIPVIMLSTACTDAQVKELKSLGAIDCITKPATFKELVDLLKRYIHLVLGSR